VKPNSQSAPKQSGDLTDQLQPHTWSHELKHGRPTQGSLRSIALNIQWLWVGSERERKNGAAQVLVEGGSEKMTACVEARRAVFIAQPG
jgi:hypothetical protein